MSAGEHGGPDANKSLEARVAELEAKMEGAERALASLLRLNEAMAATLGGLQGTANAAIARLGKQGKKRF